MHMDNEYRGKAYNIYFLTSKDSLHTSVIKLGMLRQLLYSTKKKKKKKKERKKERKKFNIHFLELLVVL